MKILVVSDTHGRNTNLEKVLRIVQPIDMLIHLGDLEGSEGYIESIAPCPVEMVCGNNDFYSALDREKILNIGKYKILITHGHNYYVGYDLSRIKAEAAKKGCNAVMFGHTHRPVIDQEGEVWALNPGSISYPRQDNRRPSYMIMYIDRKGEASFGINYL